MRRAPAVDLTVYVRALPLLARNPHIIVLPLLMAVIGVLVGQVFSPYGGGLFTVAAGGLAGLLALLLMMFGVGAACIIADEAWRRGHASFDRGWDEARRRSGEIFMAAIGYSLLIGVAQYVGSMFGAVALVIEAAVFYFLIWTLPAAAIGGVPGGAAIQVSIDRVRSAPLEAALVSIVSLGVMILVGFELPARVDLWIYPFVPMTTMTIALVSALFKAIALGYIALVITKTYTDRAFGR